MLKRPALSPSSQANWLSWPRWRGGGRRCSAALHRSLTQSDVICFVSSQFSLQRFCSFCYLVTSHFCSVLSMGHMQLSLEVCKVHSYVTLFVCHWHLTMERQKMNRLFQQPVVPRCSEWVSNWKDYWWTDFKRMLNSAALLLCLLAFNKCSGNVIIPHLIFVFVVLHFTAAKLCISPENIVFTASLHTFFFSFLTEVRRLHILKEQVSHDQRAEPCWVCWTYQWEFTVLRGITKDNPAL